MYREHFSRLAHDLAAAAAVSPVAVTITLPTHRHAPDNAQDPIRVRNAARRAADALGQLSLSREHRGALTGRLDALESEVERQVGFRHTNLGLACYVTTGQTRVVAVGHTPPERVIVSDEFSLAVPLRDVVSADDVEVLVLTTGGGSTEGARLYHLERGELVESSAAAFPMSWDVRDRDRSYANRIEAAQRDALIESFLRRVNRSLAEHYGDTDAPDMVVVGVRRLRDHWRSVSPAQLTSAVVAEVDGNVDRVPLSELQRQVEEALTAAADTSAAEALGRVANVERSKVAAGVDEVHLLAGQGRLRRLLVEEGAADEVVVDGVVIADRVALTLRSAYDSGAEILVLADGAMASSAVAGGHRIVAEARW
jgi:hypothetical protein